MHEHDDFTKPFEENRSHLRAVAFRMLGSLSEADDAVQEAWLRLSRADTSSVTNMGGWLTTVVARVCLDMLRARKARREEPMEGAASGVVARHAATSDPETEAVLADSVGLALLVVLESLAPPERLAFVLHDLFAVPFEEIASIMGRTEAATRQLASRARKRVHGAATASEHALAEQRDVVNAFLAAVRSGDIEALVAVLHPDVVIRSDRGAVPAGASLEVRGARLAAAHVIATSHGARLARPALVNGAVGIVVAPNGRLYRVLDFKIIDGKVVGIDVAADPSRLDAFEISVVE
jgi:RNA polymerase sigma factor (sigma-70 family)